MFHNSIKTVHHAKLEELRTFNKEFTVETNTTMNQLYNVNAVATVPAADGVYNKYPILEWLAIGIGAPHEGQIPRHRAVDGSLFMGIPWIARLDTPATDLPEVGVGPLRGDYSLRYAPVADTTIRGVTYKAGWVYYFLKRLDLDAVTPQKHVITITNGVPGSSVSYTHSAADLATPMPVDIDNDVLNQVEGEHITVQSSINLELESGDITELLNVCDHLFEDTSRAVVTEFGLVSAFPSGTVEAPNATFAQIMHYIGTNIPLQGSISNINLTFAVGSSMPLPDTLSEYDPSGN